MKKALGDFLHLFYRDSALLIDGEGVLGINQLNLRASADGLYVYPHLELSVRVPGWDRPKAPGDARFF